MLLAANSGGAAIFVIAYLAVVVIGIAGLWMTFTKAGQPGWTAIIPILNILVLLKVVKREWWWLLLMLIPCVSFIVWIIIALDLAKAFAKGTGFAIGLIFLSFIFVCILGFGSSEYQLEPDPLF
jgi:hypothetical protein